jgi:hypothetical protein
MAALLIAMAELGTFSGISARAVIRPLSLLLQHRWRDYDIKSDGWTTLVACYKAKSLEIVLKSWIYRWVHRFASGINSRPCQQR